MPLFDEDEVEVEVSDSFLIATCVLRSVSCAFLILVTLSELSFSILTGTRAEESTPSLRISATNGVEVEVAVLTGTGRDEGSVEGMDSVESVCSASVSAMLPSHRLLAPSRESFLASKDSLSCPSRASRHSTRQSPATYNRILDCLETFFA